MDVTLRPGALSGTVAAPVSKSHAIRLLICAALSDRGAFVECPEPPEDVRATARCLDALCAWVAREGDGYRVFPLPALRDPALPCGDCGAALRLLLPAACALGARGRFLLSGRLPERPIGPLAEQLRLHGARVAGVGEPELSFQGPVSGGTFSLPGDVSSQFVSGLLLALPVIGGDGCIEMTSPLQSSAYADMTRDAMRAFGVEAWRMPGCFLVPRGQMYASPGAVRAEGDFSGAAFWLCAAAASGGDVTVTGLNPRSRQGDRAVLGILSRMGAEVTVSGADVRVRGGKLRGARIDVRDIPDLAPPLALAALGAEGESVLTGVERLRLKESDRAAGIARVLRALGADARDGGDFIAIAGGGPLRGGRADAEGDHRLAMLAACAAALAEGPVTVAGAECVKKSYPGFFRDLAALSAGRAS